MKDIIQQLLEIEKLAEDVRGKFEAKGISLYPYPRKEYCPQHGEKWNVTVLKGIKALSEQTGVKPFQTNDIWGKPKDGFLGVLIDGVLFEQKGKPSATSYEWE